MHLIMSSAEVVSCKKLPSITDELSIEANSVDPEQTAHIGAVRSGSTLFVIEVFKHFSRRENQTTLVVIGALRVKYTEHISANRFFKTPRTNVLIVNTELLILSRVLYYLLTDK